MKNTKLTTIFFIAGSILIFFIFILLLILGSLFLNIGSSNEGTGHLSDDTAGYKYYLNEEFYQNDPFITRIPDLKDMLAGPIISPTDPSLGSQEAPVAIIIFSDYECSFCQTQEKLLEKIMDKYGDKVRLIRKDYPDSDINSISYQAAVAARCAALQNNFWQYHDKLYENNKILEEDLYYEIADTLGLNLNNFEECFEEGSGRVTELINDNIKEADALDISGVPFIYINDQEIMGQIDQKDLERIIEIELKKVN